MTKKMSFWMVMAVLNLAMGTNCLAAQFLFTPRVSVTEEYNDNIDLDRKNKKDDFITTVTPGFTAELLGQTAGARVAYDPSYSFYADHDDFNSWSHRVQGGLWNDFSRVTRFELNNYFIYTKDRLADRDVVDDQGKIIVRANDQQGKRDTFYRDYATARLSHRFGAEDSVWAQFAYGILKYDDPAGEDSQEFTPSLGLVYWFSTWTGMELDGSYTRGLYDQESLGDFQQVIGRSRLNQRISQQFGIFGEYKHIYRDYDDSLIGAGANGDYMVYAPSAGLFYQFDKDLTASLGAGWFYQQIQKEKDEQGPFVNADINKLWDFQHWNIRARATSGIDSQDFSGDAQGFERFAQVELIGKYNFTRQLFADLGLRYRYSDFINSADDVKEHRYRADAGLGYLVTSWMTVRLAYEFNKLDAINSTEDYEQNRGYLTVTLQPDQPWRW